MDPCLVFNLQSGSMDSAEIQKVSQTYHRENDFLAHLNLQLVAAQVRTERKIIFLQLYRRDPFCCYAS